MVAATVRHPLTQPLPLAGERSSFFLLSPQRGERLGEGDGTAERSDGS
jgi:hypothetical protein